jgi:hypothetical protein
MKRQKEQEQYAALLGVGVMAVVGLGAVVKFTREAREAAAVARRPKQPWEV